VFKRRKPDDPQPTVVVKTGMTNPAGGAPGTGPTAGDSGLGVPPFRPATPKEPPSMARPTFSANPNPQPVPAAGARPVMQPARTLREPSEKRTLVVGRGISLQGTVQDAERLVVEGTVETSMIHAAQRNGQVGGVFKGEAEVEDADIAGTCDGTLTVKGSLVVRSTGRLLGTARCRRLQVEDGGQITGRVEMITEGGPAPASLSTPSTPASTPASAAASA
jgi:cytoskeletal protein CcmA (bactofilin family)